MLTSGTCLSSCVRSICAARETCKPVTPRQPLEIGRSSRTLLPISCVACWPAATTRRNTKICKITYGDSAARCGSALTPIRDKRARARTASLGSRCRERPRRERPKKGIHSCCTGFGDVARVGGREEGSDSDGTHGLPVGSCGHGQGGAWTSQDLQSVERRMADTLITCLIRGEALRAGKHARAITIAVWAVKKSCG